MQHSWSTPGFIIIILKIISVPQMCPMAMIPTSHWRPRNWWRRWSTSLPLNMPPRATSTWRWMASPLTTCHLSPHPAIWMPPWISPSPGRKRRTGNLGQVQNYFCSISSVHAPLKRCDAPRIPVWRKTMWPMTTSWNPDLRGTRAYALVWWPMVSLGCRCGAGPV